MTSGQALYATTIHQERIMNRQLVLEMYPGATILEEGMLEGDWHYFLWKKQLGTRLAGRGRGRIARAAAYSDGFTYGYVLECEGSPTNGSGPGLYDAGSYISFANANDAMHRAYVGATSHGLAAKGYGLALYQAKSLLSKGEQAISFVRLHPLQVGLTVGLILLFVLSSLWLFLNHAPLR
jgi:hypothetical protein